MVELLIPGYDKETSKRIIAPFVLIASPGSERKPVALNSSSLEGVIDNVITDQNKINNILISGDTHYVIIGVDCNYNRDETDLFNYTILGIKGYLMGKDLKEKLPGIYKYFKSEIKEADSGDEIPF
ncbi:MAG: hypothetical protein AABX03_04360 [Nanoarchaeota archaeon]